MLYYLEAAVMRRRWRRAASLGESLFVIRSSPSAAHHGTMLTLGDMKRYQRRDGKKIYSNRYKSVHLWMIALLAPMSELRHTSGQEVQVLYERRGGTGLCWGTYALVSG